MSKSYFLQFSLRNTSFFYNFYQYICIAIHSSIVIMRSYTMPYCKRLSKNDLKLISPGPGEKNKTLINNKYFYVQFNVLLINTLERNIILIVSEIGIIINK